jgi:UDPglucose 6-dehydrogenase
MKNISVIGLGKLGACMAAVYSAKGFRTIGVDLNPAYVEAINAHQAPVTEPQLADYLKRGAKNLSATTDAVEAVLQTDITFMIVSTPSNAAGGFSTAFVAKACEKIGAALREKNSYHLVVLTSTVLPGASQETIIPILEESSGKKCGVDFGYCYSPEFIAIGSVIKNLLNPDFFLIGRFDEKSGKTLAEFYAKVCDNKAPVELMSIPSAELAKISINAYVTTKITFANMIAEISEKIPGADAAEVLRAMGNDKRIGHNYLKIGLGFGGPCFPRDNVAFAHMAKSRGCDAPIAKTTHDYNEKMVDRITEIVLANTKLGQKIGFLGIAYKTDTPVVEESHALKIAQKLIAAGYTVLVHEPAGHEHAKKELAEEILFENLIDLLDAADVYFLSTPDKKFLVLEEYLADKKDKTVIDPWAIIKNNNFNGSITYITLGLGK